MKTHVKLSQKQLRNRYHAECLKRARKSGLPVECFFVPQYLKSLYIKNGRVRGKNKPPKPIDPEHLSFVEKLFIDAMEEEFKRLNDEQDRSDQDPSGA